MCSSDLETFVHCQACTMRGRIRQASQIHHYSGRDGLLLFDPDNFVPVCTECHRWIDANRDEARRLGLLAKEGEWRTGRRQKHGVETGRATTITP